jgi:ceramidase
MKFTFKIALLCILTVIALVSVFVFFSPYPQDPSFHLFADHNTILGIHNFYNVISNIPFVFVGFAGLTLLKTSTAKTSIVVIYAVLFCGIILTGLGSAYYHYRPDNDALVYDRIPMTIVFMAFLSAVIAECINAKAGAALLFPLAITGISSVLWWHHTELIGQGDLRMYGFVQFYPMLAIPAILLIFPSEANNKTWRLLMWVVLWYVIAKVLEHFDKEIYSFTGFISGHSLKHIAAAVATWYMLKLFEKKYIRYTGSKVSAKE